MMVGPAAFEPPVKDLKLQAKAIQAAIVEYESAASSVEKAKALANVSGAADRLSTTSTAPGLAMARLVFWPQASAAVRVALGMGLFENIPGDGFATSEELASKCDSEHDFTQRIARAVASLGWLQEVSRETWAHTPFSTMLCNENAKASIAHMFDIVGLTMFRLNEFFEKYGYKTPTDIMNTPTVFARGVKDMDYFEWLTSNPAIYTNFNKAMALHSMTGVNGIGNVYPWDKLPQGQDGIRVIDVGGGRGHVLKDLVTYHPHFAGHICLEDLSNVLEDGSLVSDDICKKQPYNFLTQEQPVKGAAAYLFRHCLCDWPDETVVRILGYQIPAMRGNDSRLLIADLILPDTGLASHVALRDINMMQLSGVERSESQWHTLLDKAGFRIVDMFNRQDQYNSVIEAVLKD